MRYVWISDVKAFLYSLLIEICAARALQFISLKKEKIMADETTNRSDETVDANSIVKANNPISKATLIMVAAAVLFIIIAGVIIFMFYKSPTG